MRYFLTFTAITLLLNHNSFSDKLPDYPDLDYLNKVFSHALVNRHLPVINDLLQLKIELPTEINCYSYLSSFPELNLSTIDPLSYAFLTGDSLLAYKLIAAGAPIDSGDPLRPLTAAARSGSLSCVQLAVNAGASIKATFNNYGPIGAAVLSGNKNTLAYLLSLGLSPEENYYYKSPLNIAIENKDTASMNLLIKNGARCSKLDISDVVRMNSTEIARSLILCGADVNVNQPLVYAVKNNNLEIASLLLKRKAKINISTYENETPLTVAVDSNFIDLAKLLIQAGADVNFRGDTIAKTPIIIAAEKGRDSLFTLLLEKGARWRTRSSEGMDALDYAAQNGHKSIITILQKHGMDLKAELKKDKAHIFYPCAGGHYELTKFYIENGADITYVPKKGSPAITDAVLGNNIEILKLVLDAGVPIDAEMNVGNAEGFAAIDFAIYHGFAGMISYLLEHGAKLKTRYIAGGFKGWDPLMLAFRYSKDSSAVCLLDHGYDVNKKDSSGVPEFFKYMYSFKEGFLPLFVKAGANLSITDNEGQTIVHYAVVDSRPEFILTLMSMGAPIDLADRDGKTPLMIAIEKGNYETAEILIANGADVDKQNRDGISARNILQSKYCSTDRKAVKLPILLEQMDYFLFPKKKN